MATLADVRNISAGLLGRRRLGQAINDAIKTRLDQSYSYVYADLKDQRIAVWSSTSGTTIPDAVAPHVAAMMAFEATSDVGVDQAHMQRILMKKAEALPAIKRFAKADYESMDEPEDF